MSKTTFVDGNASEGIEGTIVLAAFLNAINNHRHRGLDIDGDGAIDYAVATGSSNAYAIALSPALDAYIAGMPITFAANHTNTGAATLAVCGMTAITIKKGVTNNLAAGDIQSGQIISVVYDGTSFQMISVSGNESVPVGTLAKWPTATPPSGWLARDGSAISRTTYADLFAVIGVMYGSGDGSTTFALPDDRGLFDRNWANGSTNDPDSSSRTDRGDGTTGDNVGTKQADQFKAHTHITGGNYGGVAGSGGIVQAGTDIITSSTGGNETRPINRAYLPVIKY